MGTRIGAFLSELNLISNGRLARDHRLESVVIGEGRPRGGWLIVERPCTTAEEWFASTEGRSKNRPAVSLRMAEALTSETCVLMNLTQLRLSVDPASASNLALKTRSRVRVGDGSCPPSYLTMHLSS